MASYLVGGTLFVVAVVLIKPILFPTIISFPWQDDTQRRGQTVILAGSYNPPHLGHLAMLQYLARRYEKVIAVVGFNPNKKYLVSPEQRKELLEQMIQSGGSDNIEVAGTKKYVGWLDDFRTMTELLTDVGEMFASKVVDGYIWRYGKRHGVSIFFRGIRSWEKDGSDERSLQILNTWGPMLLGPLFWPIPTHYLEGDPRYNHVASTLIRDLCSTNSADTATAVAELVPANLVDEICRLYGSKND